ncbi:hypothetical protein EYV94_07710 [Puteibacter caeruleilacunae]|nr:hypothetical protein EYV94_07710 [Puteibacter caeruleilacunae]
MRRCNREHYAENNLSNLCIYCGESLRSGILTALSVNPAIIRRIKQSIKQAEEGKVKSASSQEGIRELLETD